MEKPMEVYVMYVVYILAAYGAWSLLKKFLPA
jgi:hypothetical protein